jgi:hypothetical protein
MKLEECRIRLHNRKRHGAAPYRIIPPFVIFVIFVAFVVRRTLSGKKSLKMVRRRAEWPCSPRTARLSFGQAEDFQQGHASQNQAAHDGEADVESLFLAQDPQAGGD